MNTLFFISVLSLSLFISNSAHSEADLSVKTPAIQAIQKSMAQRHQLLSPYYESGAIGINVHGRITIRDISLIPLSARGSIQQAIREDNEQRTQLYSEISIANGHPEWTPSIDTVFADRWNQMAKPGWWIQSPDGAWIQK